MFRVYGFGVDVELTGVAPTTLALEGEGLRGSGVRSWDATLDPPKVAPKRGWGPVLKIFWGKIKGPHAEYTKRNLSGAHPQGPQYHSPDLGGGGGFEDRGYPL